MSVAQPLLYDCTWAQQWKYESAEAYYQQVLAGTTGAAGAVGGKVGQSFYTRFVFVG